MGVRVTFSVDGNSRRSYDAFYGETCGFAERADNEREE